MILCIYLMLLPPHPLNGFAARGEITEGDQPPWLFDSCAVSISIEMVAATRSDCNQRRALAVI